jgi:F420-non-reducing hydrogenase large subunit
VKKAAMALIQPGKKITEGLLNRVEMAWRPYDLCLACASHTILGQAAMEIIIYNSKGEVAERLGPGS